MSDFSKLLEIALEAPAPGPARTVKREDGTVVAVNTRNPLVADWPEPHEEKAPAKAEAKPAAPPPRR